MEWPRNIYGMYGMQLPEKRFVLFYDSLCRFMGLVISRVWRLWMAYSVERIIFVTLDVMPRFLIGHQSDLFGGSSGFSGGCWYNVSGTTP